MRLDFFIAHATGLTRSKVKALISSGAISVAGQERVSASLQLVEGQQVFCDGKLLQLPGPRYLMINKPVNVVSSTSDRDGTSVLQLLPAQWRRGRANLEARGRVVDRVQALRGQRVGDGD